jgi:hypothetical protein
MKPAVRVTSYPKCNLEHPGTLWEELENAES